MMDSFDEIKLSEIRLGLTRFKVTVKVDRAFTYEVVDSDGPVDSPTKKLLSFDVVFYDREGTRMVAKMWERRVRDMFMRRIEKGAVFHISGLWVRRDGQCVHENLHLAFNEDTEMKHSFLFLPTLIFPVHCCGDIASRQLAPNHYLDIVGFVKICSPVYTEDVMRFPEMQFFIVLSSYAQGGVWSGDELLCMMRGSWVETVHEMLQSRMDDDGEVFVLLRYVLLQNPLSTDPPLIVSWKNASSLSIDPKSPHVQDMKAKMLGSS